MQLVDRAQVLARLEAVPGPQIAIVRYRPNHNLIGNEWVNNNADIDGSKVVWARDMGSEKNQRLLNYFRDRKVWLVEPDEIPQEFLPIRQSAVTCRLPTGERVV